MAQNSKEPQGFAGFDDLISEVSEDIPSLLSTAKPAKSQPATQRVSHDASQLQGFEGFNALISEISVPEERVTPPPKTTPVAPPSVPPPRNDPPKPPTAQLPVPVKPETRVMVEPKPVPSALPQPPGAGSHKAAWFFGICGIIFILWIFSGTETNQTSRNSEPDYRPVTPAITVPTKPALNPTTDQVSPPVATTKPTPPKPQSDPLVKEIQSRLLALGYSPGVADGYAGQKTFNAIKQFQKDNQLFIDPTISKELLANLNNAQNKGPKRDKKSLEKIKNNEDEDSSISSYHCSPSQGCILYKEKPSTPVVKNEEQDSYRKKCSKIKADMNTYSVKLRGDMVWDNREDMIKYDQLYQEFQQHCTNR